MKGNLNEFVAQGKLSVGLPWWLMVKNPPAMQEPQEMWVQSLGWKDPLEEEMATYSRILAWEIPWVEELVGRGGWLNSMESQRVGHNRSD